MTRKTSSSGGGLPFGRIAHHCVVSSYAQIRSGGLRHEVVPIDVFERTVTRVEAARARNDLSETGFLDRISFDCFKADMHDLRTVRWELPVRLGESGHDVARLCRDSVLRRALPPQDNRLVKFLDVTRVVRVLASDIPQTPWAGRGNLMLSPNTASSGINSPPIPPLINGGGPITTQFS
jgi:hypothetical protein